MEGMASWEMAPGHPACEEDVKRLWDTCEQVGLTGGKLAQQLDYEDLSGSFTQLAQASGLVPTSALFLIYKQGVSSAASLEPFAKRLRGECGSSTSLSLADSTASASTRRKAGATVVVELFLPKLGLRPRQGIRRLRLEKAVASGAERASVEDGERDRWCKVLHHYLVESNTPAVKFANGCLDPERALRSFVGRARASTVRSYVRIWGMWRRWLLNAKGRAWPAGAEDLVDYLHSRLDEPCGPSVPQTLLQAVAWVEKAAGFDTASRTSSRDEVLRAFASAASSLGMDAPPTRRAPRFPVFIIMAMEIYVVNEDNPDYLRGVAWLRLVKTWASLRYDDHSWLSPSRVTFFDGELTATLTRTKTTGASRRVKELPAVVGRECYLKDPRWLEVGFRLWARMAPFARDYFLPRGTPDAKGAVPRLARYPEAAAAGIAVLRGLRGGSDVNAGPLLREEVLGFWSEHSERATLASGLAAMGVERSRRDMLGRWCPDGADTYTRTYRAVVTRLQQKFAECARGSSAYRILDEPDIARELYQWLSNVRGMKRDQADEIIMEFFTLQRGETAGTPANRYKAEEDDVASVTEEAFSDEENSEYLGLQAATADVKELRVGGIGCEYLLVYTARRRSAKLHRRDGCWVGRSSDLKDSERITDPNPDQYDTLCKFCFAATSSEKINLDEVSSVEESDSSSSDGASEPSRGNSPA